MRRNRGTHVGVLPSGARLHWHPMMMTREVTEPSPVDRTRVLRLLRAHGWNATSFQVLEIGFRYFFDGEDACVPYVETAGAWVAAGAPIAPAERLAEVAESFAAAAAQHGRRASFFATERRFTRGTRFRTLLIGEQPVWDPGEWAAGARRNLREQLRRARAKGVTVRRVAPAEVADPQAPLRRAIETLIRRWLHSRPLAPMGFLVDVQPFSFADERRYFVAERGDRVVGFLAAVPVFARNGWLFEDLLRDPQAPNGTIEAVIDFAMRSVAAEGCRFATLGLAPLSGGVGGWIGVVRDLTASLYDFRGVHAFRAKLAPKAWDPIYLSYADSSRPAAVASTRAVFDALRAFARGRLVGFGIETLLRGPSLVVRLLALLLVPWTILLATVDGRFFPSPAWRWGWVAFDVALVGALFALTVRWRRTLGVALAAIVTADAVLSAFEIAGYNLRRESSALQLFACAVAVTGPTLAAIVLWRAVGHRRAAGLE